MNRLLIKYLTFLFIIFLSTLSLPLNSLAYDMDTFLKKGIKTEEDYQYFSYYTMTDFLTNLKENNSDIMSMVSYGKTYEGRNIWLVKISDNVELDEDEPEILFIGAHHGDEWPSFEVLIYFIRHIVENYKKENTDDDEDGRINEDPIDGFDNDDDGLVDEDPSEDRVRDAINNTQIYLFPMLSPDGAEYGDSGSRKNRVPNHGPFGYKKEITSYGVNLNRNYGYNWILYYFFPLRFHFFSCVLDSSFNYRGPHPFSENETKAVKYFVENQNISLSLSYHSHSEVMFFPWYHTSKKSPHEEIFISIGENMSNINKYRLITGGDYIIPRLGGTLGTYENWAYGKHNIISFTMELCRTHVPKDPIVVLDTCLKHVGVNLYICERAQSLEIEKINTHLNLFS